MSMLDVAKFLSYSKSVDMPTDGDRCLNLSMVNSGRLFSCLYTDRALWDFDREQEKVERLPMTGKGI